MTYYTNGAIISAIFFATINENAKLNAMVSSFGDTFLLAAGIAIFAWLIAWTLKRPKVQKTVKETNQMQYDIRSLIDLVFKIFR